MNINKIVKTIILVVMIYSIALASTGSKLKKSNPEMYNDIVGTWYILSNENFGEVLFTITFNENGKVTGDINKIFSYKKVKWRAEHEKYSREWVEERGKFEIFSGPWTYSRVNYSFESNNTIKHMPEIYLNFSPPVNVCEINENCSVNNKTSFYAYVKNIDTLAEMKAKSEELLKVEKIKWSSLNKNSLKEMISFIKDLKSPELKKEASEELNKLLDKKVIKYIIKEDRYLSKHAESMVIFQNGNQICKFYEFIKSPVLFVQKASGVKPITIAFNDDGSNDFEMVCTIQGKNLRFTFKRHKGKVVLMGMASGFEVNPRNWEYAAISLAEAWNNYPEDVDYIDVDLLDGLK